MTSQVIPEAAVYEATGPCGGCGGTGDAWDKEAQDWANPLTDCEKCNGTGEAT